MVFFLILYVLPMLFSFYIFYLEVSNDILNDRNNRENFRSGKTSFYDPTIDKREVVFGIIFCLIPLINLFVSGSWIVDKLEEKFDKYLSGPIVPRD